MTAVETFQTLWVLMALPGFALLRRAGRAWLDQGAFAALSASYLTTFALLTPIGVLGYWLQWPIEVMSGALLGSMVLAVLDLARHWRDLAALPRPSLLGVIVLLLVLADYFAARRVGSYFVGDAHYHMAKIRTLMDYGFVNWDPFAPTREFDIVYHSNLYHAVIAAWAKLTGLEAVDAWSRMLPWTKLLVAGSGEALAFAVFRSRPLALAAAGASVIAWYPFTIIVYPNQLAGLWILPFALARGIDLLAGGEARRAAFGIASAGLVLSQLHCMYYAFACMLLGPPLLAAALIAAARKRPRRAVIVPVVGLLALSAGLPWLAVSALGRGVRLDVPAIDAAHLSAQADAARAEEGVEAAEAADEAPVEDARRADWRYDGFLLFGDRTIALDTGALDDPANLRVHVVVALLLLALVRDPRRSIALASFIGSVLIVLHVPFLCTMAARLAGSPWMLRRLDVIVIFTAIMVVPGVLGRLLIERRWLRGPVPHALFAGALAYAWWLGTDWSAWTRAKYHARVAQPDQQELELRKQARRAELLRSLVVPGSVIATPLGRAVELPKVCDCYAMALAEQEGLHGMNDMPERRSALVQILDVNTDNATRARLMRRFGARYIYMGVTRYSKTLRKVVAPLTVGSLQTRSGLLIQLDPERELPPEG